MISSHIGYYSLLLGFIISVSLLFYSIFYLKKNSPKINQNIFSAIKKLLSFKKPSATTPFPSSNKFGTEPL